VADQYFDPVRWFVREATGKKGEKAAKGTPTRENDRRIVSWRQPRGRFVIIAVGEIRH
jgi:hypothetical protein